MTRHGATYAQQMLVTVNLLALRTYTAHFWPVLCVTWAASCRVAFSHCRHKPLFEHAWQCCVPTAGHELSTECSSGKAQDVYAVCEVPVEQRFPNLMH